jgi:hypothetical protein
MVASQCELLSLRGFVAQLSRVAGRKECCGKGLGFYESHDLSHAS